MVDEASRRFPDDDPWFHPDDDDWLEARSALATVERLWGPGTAVELARKVEEEVGLA